MSVDTKAGWHTVESGPHDHMPMLHPVAKKNYGNWKYHERPRPGVLRHVSWTGDELFTVRAGTHRQVTVDIVRRFCDLADKYADGFLRWTVRNNVEFMTPSRDNAMSLVKELEALGHPVGGTGNSISALAHTQGWLHCDIPATDASGVVKSIMDEIIHDFTHEEMPNRVKMSTSCCEINCGGQADIAIVIQHTRPPRINHDILSTICEMPQGRGPLPGGCDSSDHGEWQTVGHGRGREMHRLRRLLRCLPGHRNQPSGTFKAGHLGGRKNSNARSKPSNMKLVAFGLPNNPPAGPRSLLW